MTVRNHLSERNESESRQIHLNQRDLEEMKESFKASSNKIEELGDMVTELKVYEAEKRGRDRVIGVIAISLIGLTQGFILLILNTGGQSSRGTDGNKQIEKSEDGSYLVDNGVFLDSCPNNSDET